LTLAKNGPISSWAEFRETPLLHVPLAFGEFRPEPVQLHLINEFFIVLHETQRLTDYLTGVVVKARSDLAFEISSSSWVSETCMAFTSSSKHGYTSKDCQ